MIALYSSPRVSATALYWLDDETPFLCLGQMQPGSSPDVHWARLNLRGCCQNSLRRGRADHFIPHEILAGEGLVEAGYSADEVCRKVREKSR